MESIHQDYIDCYMDGRDEDCPEPNENRSWRYKHSFAIGRAEIRNKYAGSYDYLINKAKEAEEKESAI